MHVVFSGDLDCRLSILLTRASQTEQGSGGGLLLRLLRDELAPDGEVEDEPSQA